MGLFKVLAKVSIIRKAVKNMAGTNIGDNSKKVLWLRRQGHHGGHRDDYDSQGGGGYHDNRQGNRGVQGGGWKQQARQQRNY